MKRNFFSIAYLIIGFLTVFEFLFITGMFTGPIMMFLVTIFGLINLVIEWKDRKWMTGAYYILTTVALLMGYFYIMI